MGINTKYRLAYNSVAYHVPFYDVDHKNINCSKNNGPTTPNEWHLICNDVDRAEFCYNYCFINCVGGSVSFNLPRLFTQILYGIFFKHYSPAQLLYFVTHTIFPLCYACVIAHASAVCYARGCKFNPYRLLWICRPVFGQVQIVTNPKS